MLCDELFGLAIVIGLNLRLDTFSVSPLGRSNIIECDPLEDGTRRLLHLGHLLDLVTFEGISDNLYDLLK